MPLVLFASEGSKHTPEVCDNKPVSVRLCVCVPTRPSSTRPHAQTPSLSPLTFSYVCARRQSMTGQSFAGRLGREDQLEHGEEELHGK